MLINLITSPKFVAGAVGGIVLGAAGITILTLTNKEKAIQIRKKLATAIRDMADNAIESLDKAAEELKNTVEEVAESAEENLSDASPRGKKQQKGAHSSAS